MRRRMLLAVMATLVAAVSIGALPHTVQAQADDLALCGTASAAEDGALEGVLVTARRAGAPMSVTVSTNERGRYCFPRTHLAPGEYALRIRATGYDLDGSPRAVVAADRQATVDLTLRETVDLAAQLTSQEWIISAPLTPGQKHAMQRQVINCNFCHTLERVVRTRYTSEEWIPVIQRMNTYHPDFTGSVRVQTWGGMGLSADDWWTLPVKDLADSLASMNLGRGATWSYPLQTLPRPEGRATSAIVTVYDIPRQPSVIHDLDVDTNGNVWYGNTGYDFLGKLDPKTGTFSEYPAPNYSTQQGGVVGLMDVQADPEGGIWANIQGGLARFDSRTLEWKRYDLPRSPGAFTAPFRGTKATTVWTHSGLRIDAASGAVDDFNPRGDSTDPHTPYMVDRDSQDNAFFTDYGRFGYQGSYISRIDGKTGEVTFYPTPTSNAFPRRGYIDPQDRFWFGEFYGDRIGMFDTRSEQFKEFPTPHPYSSPYYARPDKNGDIWASSNGSDRVLRLDPETGEFLEYLMPVYYDARKVVTDPSTNTTTVWLPNKNMAQLIRVEVPD